MTPPLVLSMGEPAGIGGEIALDAWRRREAGVPVFAAIDDPERLARLARDLGAPVPVRPIALPGEALAVWHEALPVLPLKLTAPVVPGRIDPAHAPAVIAAIEIGVRLVTSGQASALVTNPIQKESLAAAGFRHPGHTEFLAELAGGMTPVMMIACDALKVVPITIHEALGQAIRRLTTPMIVEAGIITAAGLRQSFGIDAPRLAVAGLNPHAGEGGLFGREDIEIIRPAVERLRALGIDAIGPLSPDTMFHTAARARYDVALCMYHDQALIPIKTIDFDHGVNVTLGLPFVRTSPDHGTALDIAGTGRASSASLIAALKLAAAMAGHRAARAA